MASVAGWFAGVPAAGAATRGRIDVVKLSGLIDPTNVDLVHHSLADAATTHAQILIVQLNSTGGTISPQRAADLAASVHASVVPVAVWVGGSSRPRAYGAAYALMRAAAFSGVGPGARIGDALPSASGPPDSTVGHTVAGEAAVIDKLVNVSAPTIGDFIVSLNGHAFGGAPPLSLTATVMVNNQPRQEIRPDYDVYFARVDGVPPPPAHRRQSQCGLCHVADRAQPGDVRVLHRRSGAGRGRGQHYSGPCPPTASVCSPRGLWLWPSSSSASSASPSTSRPEPPGCGRSSVPSR